MSLKFIAPNIANTPDPAVTDCEEILETLSRLEQLALKLKAKACRGCDSSAVDLVSLKDSVYTILAECLSEAR